MGKAVGVGVITTTGLSLVQICASAVLRASYTNIADDLWLQEYGILLNPHQHGEHLDVNHHAMNKLPVQSVRRCRQV